jgi:hypothetical protein
MVKLVMLRAKVRMTPESYCSQPPSRALLPFFKEVMNMQYAQEPSYGHLQFLLTVPLLEQGLVPTDCVFSRPVPDNILIRSN